MASARGRLSEGMDFKDEYARCIVLVGVPNLDISTDQFKAKRDYLIQFFKE